MNTNNPGYVVVEGPIGVGKTSLAVRLAEVFGAKPILEHPEENPFLERFYQSRKSFALPTQLFFLFQRARQLEQIKQSDMFSSGYVSDFLLDKDKLFARANLDDDELRLYGQVYAQMSLSLPVPDLVIYLQAPEDVLLKRIAKRGIRYERRIDAPYLRNLSEAYARMFLNYDAAPVLIVNAEHINLVDNDRDYEALLEQIHVMRQGKHYFNPTSTVL